MHVFAALLAIVAAVVPMRNWYAPSQPLTVDVKSEGDAKLVLTDFNGTAFEPKTPVEVNGDKTVDLKGIYEEASRPGTYVLYVVPKGKTVDQFTGAPWVIEVRSEKRGGAPADAMVTYVRPLEYAVMTTDKGPLTMVFYFDVAPITAESFLYLSRTGYYNGLTFHRIVPGFVIQGGDPKGDGTGGPGYNVQAEFNDRKHQPGVLSMARQGDPNEQAGAMPRAEYANSAGSQFFICLDYSKTVHLDHKYTAFGKVVNGMDAVDAIAHVPLADAGGRPQTPQHIQKVEVKPVTAADNPYAEMMGMKKK
ncbi:MAG TPA: peptidylprolyl isomerase [Humisphaera sp.]|jgi:peptidyl-prolyl cis-trans isomerase B (cyclophilin B)|nr:peptidylprolyl isomerase [Humisphaera sp.]